MDTLRCEKCGAAMALAESLCVACGHPAPAGRAAQRLKSMAEAAYEQGNLELALRHMAKAIESGLKPEELPLAWRKSGVWQEKRYNQDPKPEFLSSAENSYFKALSFDDSDELAHQLFIACLGRQGQTLRAVTLYQQRLAKNPQDAIAQKYLNAIKLAMDIKAAPPPVAKVDLNEGGMFGRMFRNSLKPSPWKVSMLVISLIGTLFMLFSSGNDAHDTEMLTSMDGIPASALDIFGVFSNPWVLGIEAAAMILILALMYRRR